MIALLRNNNLSETLINAPFTKTIRYEICKYSRAKPAESD